MSKINRAITVLIVAAIMIGCGNGRTGAPVGTLTLQYEVVHQEAPTRIDRGDSIVGIRFKNPNDIPVKVNRITLTKLGTASDETIEVLMLDPNENVHTALQTRSGDSHTFETDNLVIPPGEHIINFRIFVSEPCQTIGYTIQSDDDVVASGENGEEVRVTQGPNSVIAEPVQVFGNNIIFSPDADNPQSQTVQQGADGVVAMVFNVNAQLPVETRYSFVFMDHLPWDIAEHVIDFEISVLVDGEWILSLGPEDLHPDGCEPSELDCYVQFSDAYSIFEACTDTKMRVKFSLSPTIPSSTEIEFYIFPSAWGFYDLENDEVFLSGATGDVLRSPVFTVVP